MTLVNLRHYVSFSLEIASNDWVGIEPTLVVFRPYRTLLWPPVFLCCHYTTNQIVAALPLDLGLGLPLFAGGVRDTLLSKADSLNLGALLGHDNVAFGRVVRGSLGFVDRGDPGVL